MSHGQDPGHVVSVLIGLDEVVQEPVVLATLVRLLVREEHLRGIADGQTRQKPTIWTQCRTVVVKSQTEANSMDTVYNSNSEDPDRSQQ